MSVRKQKAAPPTWVPDEHSENCQKCKGGFTMMNRRHHCRRCGLLVCGDCSLKKMALPQFQMPEPVRVCDDCFQYESTFDKIINVGVPYLQNGAVFSKHGATGKPHLRVVKLCPNAQRLCYKPTDASGDEKHIDLSTITEILEGQRTTVFQRTGTPGKDSCCFSILSPQHDLHLEAQSPEVRKLWVEYLKDCLKCLKLKPPEEINDSETWAIAKQRQMQARNDARQERIKQLAAMKAKYNSTDSTESLPTA
eukprot:Colp12_sorted_trinity150504_noHs@23252